MRKITVTTTKEVVCKINHKESTLSSEQVKNFVKEQGLVPDYDEIHMDVAESVVKFIKYTHNFAVEL